MLALSFPPREIKINVLLTQLLIVDQITVAEIRFRVGEQTVGAELDEEMFADLTKKHAHKIEKMHYIHTLASFLRFDSFAINASKQPRLGFMHRFFC